LFQRLSRQSFSLGIRQRLRKLHWFGWFTTLASYRLRYRRALLTIRPDVVCLAEDIIGPLSAPMIQAARQLRLPSVIVPFTIPNPLEALVFLFNNPGPPTLSAEHDAAAAAF